jgi:predicted DCC family thiol-disulfide oxidoreductase YuxK
MMTTSSAVADSKVPLPGVNERPQADVVIYDGRCVFCTGQVERLARWDRHRSLAFLSLHDPMVAARYPDLTHEQLMEQIYVVTRHGGRHAGAAAFRYLSRKLPRLWPLAPIMHIPFSLPLWQWCYRQVAKRRYRIAGKDTCDGDACDVHFK